MRKNDPKIVVVGGVAGGASTAARARRLNEHSEVIIMERGPHVSFSNCCLPFHLSKMIPDSDNLVLMHPKEFADSYKIEARVNNEVLSIDRENKSVTVKNLESGESYVEEYDKLVLSPGAFAIMPQSIKGIDGENVFKLKNVVDVKAIQDFIDKHDVQEVAVVGGGYIGLEVVENLVEAGKTVHLVEKERQVLRTLDYDMVQGVHKELHDHGVKMHLGAAVTEIYEDKVVLDTGEDVPCQLVVMAIGVRPEVKLAEEAGLEIGETGGIKVNQHYQTSDPDIYAVGDAIEVHHRLTGKKTLLPLAGPAQRQARAAADHIFGKQHNNNGVIGSSSIHLFDLNIAATGLNAGDCERNGIDYDFVLVIPGDKVGLMPGVAPLFFKLIYEYPTGRLLGAQAYGHGEAEKRIDVIATLISMGGTLEDLKELELCYSPHYGTAKDVVNHAALVGLNLLYGQFRQVGIDQVRPLVEEDACIIDVREKHEWDRGHIKNAINIPMSEFRQRLDEIPKDRPVYLHCRSSQRSYNVIMALQGLGFDNLYNIAGSYLGLSVHEYFLDQTTDRECILTEYNFN
ncbi:MAG: FAD-dependent oxidoreductase [Eubacteriales bacterium]|nr:FAD-dependent oxidoreductase [Eubacteriales bacterium]